MTALSLTKNLTYAGVNVLITAAPAGAVTITRSDDSGQGPVRLMQGQTVSGGALTVIDRECALTGTARYSVTDSAGTVTSATISLTGLTTVPQLTVPLIPSMSTSIPSPTMITDYDASRGTLGTVHDIIGRPDPIVVVRRMRTRRGTLAFEPIVSYAEARRIESVFSLGHVVLLRQLTHAGMDMYAIAERTRITPSRRGSQTWWSLDVDYVETVRPSGFLQGTPEWTYALLSTSVPTYNDVVGRYTSYTDVLIGA